MPKTIKCPSLLNDDELKFKLKSTKTENKFDAHQIRILHSCGSRSPFNFNQSDYITTETLAEQNSKYDSSVRF